MSEREMVQEEEVTSLGEAAAESGIRFTQPQEMAQVEEEGEDIEVLDLDAVKRRRSRVQVEGRQYEINRQCDLEDEDITRLNSLNKMVDEAETPEMRKPLNLELLKIMMTTYPSDEILANLSDGLVRYIKNFFYRGWGSDMENLIKTVKASEDL